MSVGVEHGDGVGVGLHLGLSRGIGELDCVGADEDEDFGVGMKRQWGKLGS